MAGLVIATAVAPMLTDAASAADATGPTLTGVTLDQSTVDVSDGPRTVSGTVTAYDVDDEGGVQLGFVEYEGPSGVEFSQTLRFGPPVSGVSTAAFTIDVPAFIRQGDYALAQVQLDASEDAATYPSDVPFPATNVARTVHVIDADPDVEAPTLVGVSTSQASLDVSSTAGSLTVDVHLADAQSGVASGAVTLTSPSQENSMSRSFAPQDRVSGSASDGVYEVTFPFDPASENGNWTIGASAVDDRDNSAMYSGNAVMGTNHVVVHAQLAVPSAPYFVLAGLADNGSLAVFWRASKIDGGSPITSYKIIPYQAGVAQAAVVVGAVGAGYLRITGLTNGVPYTFTVQATNAIGDSAESVPSSPTAPQAEPPAIPANATAEAGDGNATVAWLPPLDDGGSPVLSYDVTTYDGATSHAISTKTGITGLATTTIYGLTNNSGYYFGVTAVNAVGAGSEQYTDHVVFRTTAPGAPTSVRATPGDRDTTVRWTAPINDGGSAVTGNTVTALPGGHTCTTTVETSCTVPGLTNGVAYTFTVVASNDVGPSTASDPSTAVTPRASTTVSFRSLRTTTTFGSAANVVATIATGTVSPGGDPVRLQYRHRGSTGAFATFATAHADSAGVVRFSTFAPAYTVEVRLVLPAGTTYLASTSGSAFVSVARRVSIASNHSAVARGKTFVLGGAVAPNAKGRKALLERRSGSSWVRVASTAITTGSRYSFTVRGAVKGRFAYRVAVGADHDYALSVSPTKTVTIT